MHAGLCCALPRPVSRLFIILASRVRLLVSASCRIVSVAFFFFLLSPFPLSLSSRLLDAIVTAAFIHPSTSSKRCFGAICPSLTFPPPPAPSTPLSGRITGHSPKSGGADVLEFPWQRERKAPAQTLFHRRRLKRSTWVRMGAWCCLCGHTHTHAGVYYRHGFSLPQAWMHA